MVQSRELDLLERISNLLRNETRAGAQSAGLQPVQLDVLGYLARCNRYSDTPASVTEYLGLTKGTVSQSILRLEEKGLVERKTDPADARRSHLKLTTSGRRVARSVRKRSLKDALGADRELRERLEQILRALQKRNGQRSFGVCQTCRFFEDPGGTSFRCGLTQEPLSRSDSAKICREHERREAS